jgi:hypothetical protein
MDLPSKNNFYHLLSKRRWLHFLLFKKLKPEKGFSLKSERLKKSLAFILLCLSRQSKIFFYKQSILALVVLSIHTQHVFPYFLEKLDKAFKNAMAFLHFPFLIRSCIYGVLLFSGSKWHYLMGANPGVKNNRDNGSPV